MSKMKILTDEQIKERYGTHIAFALKGLAPIVHKKYLSIYYGKKQNN